MTARIRKIGGLLSLAVLLGLVAADTLHTGITLQPDDKALLVSLVSALLGIDAMIRRSDVLGAAISAAVEELGNGDSGSDSDSGGSNNDD